jgi:uncharacterized membrane protein YkvA (DUF1232 family)
MNYARIFRIFSALRSQADSYRDDEVRGGELAEDALAKANKNKGALGRIGDDLQAFTRLLRAWATRRYRSMPWRSLSLVVAALLYFVSPLDAIPDFIPVLGFVDDIFIVTWVMRAIQKDVEKFRSWEQSAA